MRVWLYARLSGDDDPAQNSLQNQQEICRAFAETFTAPKSFSRMQTLKSAVTPSLDVRPMTMSAA